MDRKAQVDFHPDISIRFNIKVNLRFYKKKPNLSLLLTPALLSFQLFFDRLINTGDHLVGSGTDPFKGCFQFLCVSSG